MIKILNNSLQKLFFGLFIFAVSFSCKKSKVEPISESSMAKIWIAGSVTEDNVTVYSRASSNQLKPGYANYTLDLSLPPKAILRDVDNTTFIGTYSVKNNELILTGLNPEPSNTGGNLRFKISKLSDSGSNVTLVATSTYSKTGNSLNVYNLVKK